MKRLLHELIPIPVFFLLFLSPAKTLAQGSNRVDIGKSYANMSQLSTGGTYNPGDTIEIRVTIAVIKQTTTTIVDSVQVFDAVPANTTYINGSMRVATNQGLTYKGPFTEAYDGDAGYKTGNNITINLGKGADSSKGGRIKADSSRPSFYNSTCIMMAVYRVQINATASYGDTLKIGGSVKYKMISPANGWTTVTFPTYQILLFKNTGYCQNGSNVSAASDSLGTFASGSTQNRPSALGFTTSYIKQNISVGQPNDYYYAIVNNSSADGSTNPNSAMPEGTIQHRVFGLWDICGDHTGATDPAMGNPPAAPGTRKGYFVVVNASYNTNEAYQETLSNLCPNTYYEFSAWFRNVCPRCSCDSMGRGSGTAGFIPYPGNDSSGVKPNLSFEIDGLSYFTSGDIKYDRTEPWKQYGFTFLTRPTQTTANFVIRNNSPGGGGNDWAIDDIKVAHCGPSLNMNYNPYVQGCKEGDFVVSLSDTIRFIYNSYVHFKWQKSNVGGTIWTDMTGPGTSGIGSPVMVNGLWQYITALPPWIASYADSGTFYRVIVATTAANLNSADCQYKDGSSTMVSVITCGLVLNGNFIQFKGTLSGNKAYLNWITKDEKELKNYEIERSNDGINFERIGSVTAKNTPDAFYNFTDPDIVNGTKYYRLKMRDVNNRYKFSNVIVLSTALAFDIRHVQNPFTNKIAADVIAPEDGTLNVLLFNDKGQKMHSYSQQVKKGMSRISVDNLPGMSSGIYILAAELNKESIRRKIIRR